MYRLYGISNCDTVKKAKAFLEASGIDFEFIDFKKQRPLVSEIKLWTEKLGGLPVNKAGRTYKQFKDSFESVTEAKKIEFLQDQTSLIKRPILVRDGSVMAFGYKLEEYQELFNPK